MLPYKGQKVIARIEIDRYPHFTIPARRLGTVVSPTDHSLGTVLIEMDENVPGAETWSNCVQCWTLSNYNREFQDLLTCQLEAALTIICRLEIESMADYMRCHEWVVNTCKALKDAGSNHPAIAKVLGD